MASSRLPGKPLIEIKGKSMLLRVWEKASKSKVGDVIVACCDKEIKEYLNKKKISYIMTSPYHKSGTDRIFEAYEKIKNNKKYKYIINLQGDLPNINPRLIKTLSLIIKEKNVNIATLASEIKTKNKIKKQSVVKVVLGKKQGNFYDAIYFSRAPIPYEAKKYYEHIGIYAYTIKSLNKFISFKTSKIEMYEKLEQLRALENQLKITVGLVKTTPISIDTSGDLNLLLKSKLI